MVNVSQIPEIEKNIQNLIIRDNTDESPAVTEYIMEVTGPASGIIYKPGENGAMGKIVIAEGYAPLPNGDIVKLDDATGPATGMIYRDGNWVKAQ